MSYNGKSSPLLPVENSHFHSSTQLRFTFNSDSSGNDIGYWIDEIVIIYDQAAKQDEFQVQTTGISTLGGLPGDWSTTRFEMTNIGNISERFTPSVIGIPTTRLTTLHTQTELALIIWHRIVTRRIRMFDLSFD